MAKIGQSKDGTSIPGNAVKERETKDEKKENADDTSDKITHSIYKVYKPTVWIL